jgi:hypothetical protein
VTFLIHAFRSCMVLVLVALATGSGKRASGAAHAVVDDCTFDAGTSTVTAHIALSPIDLDGRDLSQN